MSIYSPDALTAPDSTQAVDRLAAALARIEAALAAREAETARLLRIEAEAREVLSAVETLLQMPN